MGGCQIMSTCGGSADTFLLVTRVLHWTLDDFEHWLLTTWRALLRPPKATQHLTDRASD